MKQSAARPFRNTNVAKVFAAYPDHIRGRLMTLRTMIFETAAQLDGVGPLEETLKWSQPSYLTTASRTGSTIRIDRVSSDDACLAMYFNCQTDLVATFRELYPTQMEYGGNRSILFDAEARFPEQALRHCIGLALTYHARKTTGNKAASGKANFKTAASKKAATKKSAATAKRAPAKPTALRTRRAPQS